MEIFDEFFTHSRRALRGGDPRLCLVYMKHVTVDSEEVAHVILEAAFLLWTDWRKKSLLNVGKVSEQDLVAVMDAYTKILTSGIKV